MQLIQEHCKGITTLELEIIPDHPLRYNDGKGLKAQTLKQLDIYFKEMLSLNVVTVNFPVYFEQSDYSRERDEYFMKRIQEYGWVIRVTEVPLPERAWIDWDANFVL